MSFDDDATEKRDSHDRCRFEIEKLESELTLCREVSTIKEEKALEFKAQRDSMCEINAKDLEIYHKELEKLEAERDRYKEALERIFNYAVDNCDPEQSAEICGIVSRVLATSAKGREE